MSTYGRDTNSPVTAIRVVRAGLEFASLELIAAAIIKPLKYWLLTEPPTLISPARHPAESIATGGHPFADSARIVPFMIGMIASTRSPIGRSCIRETPCRLYRPPAADSAAVRKRIVVPLLAINSEWGAF